MLKIFISDNITHFELIFQVFNFKINMSLARGRERRSGAGARMARLINEEEEDEFYATTYGGFEETEDDNEYK